VTQKTRGFKGYLDLQMKDKVQDGDSLRIMYTRMRVLVMSQTHEKDSLKECVSHRGTKGKHSIKVQV
jgi:hypothetical protein